MTRRPDADETLVLGERSGWKGGERFYLRDLALYLHQSAKSVRKWARRQGLIKHQSLKIHASATRVEYFTRYGALRVIAHFRALQGEMHLAGKDYHRWRESKDGATRRYRSKRQCR